MISAIITSSAADYKHVLSLAKFFGTGICSVLSESIKGFNFPKTQESTIDPILFGGVSNKGILTLTVPRIMC